jgi:glycosyltransferase involved in cell wall biosynthesis
VQSLHQLISGVAAVAPGAPRRPTVLTFHAPYHEEFLARHREGRSDGSVGAVPAALSAILRQGDRYLVRRSHEVLVLSEFAQFQVEALDPSVRVTQAPAGVDTDRFAPPADEAERRACLKALGFAPDGPPLIVTVRRLVPRMGLADLVEAAGKLGQPFRLAIAGEGPERAALEAHLVASGLDRHVRLLGRLPENQLPALYRAASMFVLPTRSLEGFGMATVEALASGLPVIATTVAANIEVLRGVAGATLVPPNDPAALAAAMETWLADPTAAAEAGLASRAHACSTLGWDRHLDAFEQAAERAVAAGVRA